MKVNQCRATGLEESFSGNALAKPLSGGYLRIPYPGGFGSESLEGENWKLGPLSNGWCQCDLLRINRFAPFLISHQQLVLHNLVFYDASLT